mgnify:CR=1 FL=1
MSFKFRYAKRSFIMGLQAITELNQAFIGGSLLGAFVAKDYMEKEDVEEWVEKQEKQLFYALGALEGLKIRAPWLYNAYYHYTKSQAIATCVYKRYWRVKTFVKVEGTKKTEEKANVGTCTKFEAPECPYKHICMSMSEFWER